MDMRISQARRQMAGCQTDDRTEAVALLKAMPLLKGIRAGTLALLAEHAAGLRYERDEIVFRRGSVPTGLFFVIEGGIKLLALEPDGREKVIELFTEKRFFGEIGVFRLARYRAWTQAVRATRLLHIPSDALRQAVREDHDLALRMLSEVSGRVQSLIESISQTAPLLAHKRVAAYLIEQQGAGDAPAGCVRLAAPKYTIASMLNLSSEALSRALRKLRDAGLIDGGGRTIRILDHEALSALLND
ncbi:Crp/Fnr family transcriptional regulator [Denitromonas iodatirespirans]|uniref:Crp/Fnr family transcriptional regulator n=1 Tax=Denitromonas iodatirespirans TaxID=2795389 RepID=A0A944DBE7_DENI1|nr:Crp/Fnr family transcriptional regulator [Denitromonas iodatirespirans]MBT0961337.1 Crp/Fnr family transcriptional regulator [Denitromonas iodatirespirans]